MSEKLAKYIITTGGFDGETDKIKIARKVLKSHASHMKEKYPNDDDTYGIYMLIETEPKKAKVK